jgi:hypothetical protein
MSTPPRCRLRRVRAHRPRLHQLQIAEPLISVGNRCEHRSGLRVDTGFDWWLTRFVVIRKMILMVGVVVVIAFVFWKGSGGSGEGQPILSFRIARLDFFSFERPVAFVAVTNEGRSTAKWGYHGCWAEIETSEGYVTNKVTRGGVMEPGGQDVFTVRLPPETKRWRVRCVVSEASTRQRVSFKLGQHWNGKIAQLGREILSEREGAKETVFSPLFSVENFVEIPKKIDRSITEIDFARITEIGL